MQARPRSGRFPTDRRLHGRKKRRDRLRPRLHTGGALPRHPGRRRALQPAGEGEHAARALREDMPRLQPGAGPGGHRARLPVREGQVRGGERRGAGRHQDRRRPRHEDRAVRGPAGGAARLLREALPGDGPARRREAARAPAPGHGRGGQGCHRHHGAGQLRDAAGAHPLRRRPGHDDAALPERGARPPEAGRAPRRGRGGAGHGEAPGGEHGRALRPRPLQERLPREAHGPHPGQDSRQAGDPREARLPARERHQPHGRPRCQPEGPHRRGCRRSEGEQQHRRREGSQAEAQAPPRSAPADRRLPHGRGSAGKVARCIRPQRKRSPRLLLHPGAFRGERGGERGFALTPRAGCPRRCRRWRRS